MKLSDVTVEEWKAVDMTWHMNDKKYLFILNHLKELKEKFGSDFA